MKECVEGIEIGDAKRKAMKKPAQQVIAIFLVAAILLVAVSGAYWHQSTYRNETHIVNVTWLSGVLEFDVVHTGLTPQSLYMVDVESDGGCRSTAYSSVCYVQAYWEKIFNITMISSQTVHVTTAAKSNVAPSRYTHIPAPTDDKYVITLFYYVPNDKMFNYTYPFYSLTFNICGSSICSVDESTAKIVPAIT